MMNSGVLAVLIALPVAAMLASPASADIVRLEATLDGHTQVPPTDSRGAGSAEMTFDTGNRHFTWTITYQGTTDAPTAAHFHGPAEPGRNAGPVLPLTGDLSSPMTGESTLSEAEANDLMSGRWYINIHTAQYPGGEIRGQVMKSPPQ